MRYKIVYAILIILGCLFIGVTLVDYEKTIDKQNKEIQNLKEELKETEKSKKYYLELSEELQNQMGVYIN